MTGKTISSKIDRKKLFFHAAPAVLPQMALRRPNGCVFPCPCIPPCPTFSSASGNSGSPSPKDTKQFICSDTAHLPQKRKTHTTPAFAVRMSLFPSRKPDCLFLFPIRDASRLRSHEPDFPIRIPHFHWRKDSQSIIPFPI